MSGSSMYVVDSSVYASIIVKDEFHERARRFILGTERRRLATVATAYLEVANTLWKHTYLLRRIPVESFNALRKTIAPLINASTGEIHDPLTLLDDALGAAAEYSITVYDALFVALALRLRARLASFDEKLRTHLESRGLDIVYTP